mgnify:CR=1 FL=1
MSKTTIYADHAATTALSPAAYEAMLPWLQDKYGNPSTLYSLARDPRKAVAHSREVIAAAINVDPSEVFFTSGGTEADNWALKGTMFQYDRGKGLITSAIEHHAILNSCVALERMGYAVGTLPVDKMGIVQAEALQSALSDNILLVSTMLANNEIGTIEPVAELAEIVHQAGALFHTDAVQAIGHIPVDAKKLDVDMLSASAHKFNGPKGIGFLYVRKGVNLVPLLDGGGQEQGMRAGTESVAGIVGMAAALQEHMEQLTQETEYLNELSNRLIDQLKRKELDFRINGSHNRIPGSLSLSFKATDGEMLLHRLDLMGTAVATGSACNSKDTVLSHVIQAISVPQEYAHGTIRVTLGMDNTVEQVDRIAQQIASILR